MERGLQPVLSLNGASDLNMNDLARVAMLPTSQELAALSLAQLPLLYQQHYQLLQLFRETPYLQQGMNLHQVKRKYQNVSTAKCDSVSICDVFQYRRLDYYVDMTDRD